MKNIFNAKPKGNFSSPERQSMGIFDDFAVRKNVATKEGTIEQVPTADNHIVNKKYVDNSISAIPTCLKIDQTVPQTIINGTPVFHVGLKTNADININEYYLNKVGSITDRNLKQTINIGNRKLYNSTPSETFDFENVKLRFSRRK